MQYKKYCSIRKQLFNLYKLIIRYIGKIIKKYNGKIHNAIYLNKIYII